MRGIPDLPVTLQDGMLLSEDGIQEGRQESRKYVLRGARPSIRFLPSCFSAFLI
jgi:hypothetical protein